MPTKDFRLGDWIVRPQRCLIEHGNESVRVKPKCMAVLCRLADAPGEVVSRNELFDSVWPGGEVTDDVLTRCVVELRKAFGDSARNPEFIETIPKMGLRLIPEVGPVDVAAADHAGARHEVKSRRYAAITLVAVAAGIAAYFVSDTFRQLPGDYAGKSQALGAAEAFDPERDAMAEEKTVAVLPFVDMSPAQDQEYFADGLSEELINRLTQLDGLLVTGRTSSFFFKNRNEDLRAIGEFLSVRYILEGSVRKSGDDLRVTAQLIDVRNGFHLWSNSYDRQNEDVFEIQNEIAESVAEALSVELGIGIHGTLQGATSDFAAYEAFMRGNAYFDEFTVDGMQRALVEYRRAVEIDPDFALAWASMAEVHANFWLVGGSAVKAERYELAERAIQAALRAAPNSQRVLLTAAFIASDYLEWDKAQRYIDRARQQGEAPITKLSGAYAHMRYRLGYTSEVLELRRRAQRIEPMMPLNHTFTAHLYLTQGMYEEAWEQVELGWSSADLSTYIANEGVLVALTTRDDERIRTWLARAADNAAPGGAGADAAMLERFGDRDGALAWLRDAYERNSSLDYYVTIWASYYGDDALALDAMGRSRDLWLFWIPSTQHLRRTQTFRDIVTDAGLVDYWRKYGWNDYCKPLGETEFECG